MPKEILPIWLNIESLPEELQKIGAEIKEIMELLYKQESISAKSN